MLDIYVDADACPVKEEAARVAKRYGLSMIYVSNSALRTPEQEGAKRVLVEGHADAADDWIAGHISVNDIVLTADIPLAYRCVKGGARVLDFTGRILSEENIGEALALRDLMHDLRNSGTVTGGGPAAFQKQDRSRFLHSLDQIIQLIKRDEARKLNKGISA